MSRVLVVEDNPEERASMVAFLKSWGYETEEASSIYEALHVLSDSDFHAIVCGVLPADNGGFWLHHEVRIDPHHKEDLLFAFWCLTPKDGLPVAVAKDKKGIYLVREPGSHQKLLDFLNRKPATQPVAAR